MVNNKFKITLKFFIILFNIIYSINFLIIYFLLFCKGLNILLILQIY